MEFRGRLWQKRMNMIIENSVDTRIQKLKVLIVEDNPDDCALYLRQLGKEAISNYSFAISETGAEGIKLCLEQNPDCILLDYALPDMDGLQFLSIINDKGYQGAIIMLTGQGNESIAVQAMKGGAHDYIVKENFSKELFFDTVINAINTNQNDETKIWKTRALVDSLTGVLNRTAYSMSLEQTVREFQRYEEPTVLAVVDIDHFKSFNDLYGHKVGDNILRLVATSLSNSIRPSDLVFRYGGEEFVILLKRISMDAAKQVADKMRQNIESLYLLHEGKKLGVTVSLGLTSLQKTDSEETLFKRADQAMYSAKQSGRNCIKIK